ncbi:MAG: protein kinase [Gemmatimonadaceae bacterium]|nr:protein kinase [Gemmatimonadaceae bacterium]
MPATDRLKAALSDRYHIERELGSGGMATVYLARDLKHDREVALKVLRADLSAVIGTERFLAEVRITAGLDHPHILTLIDSGSAEGILYYVLPYVRGESLRGKLNREKQLGVDEALSIVRQVASALDYAHGHGVVHRDIKPENILLHEGEAMLADFGIALAVSEAGGNRLTETGLSLGTPQYMSPEQATGDRALDKRSDIYSLAAVFYEMISGEPPVTGATAQAMIAKLLTERPVKLRVVRPTISMEMERATEKALSKVPADRFTSAGEFVRALAVVAPERTSAASGKGKWWWTIGGVAAATVIGTALWMAGPGSAGPSRVPVTLRDRTQLTQTGTVSVPSISDDGKVLAYVVTDCGRQGCRYAIDFQDVTGGPTRRLLDGASAIYRLEISPDRRNIVMMGSVNGVFGSYIVSTIGGAPRFVNAGFASFYAGGDSLLLTKLSQAAEYFWMRVSGLDGVPVDSIRIQGPSVDAPRFVAFPGTQYIVHEAVSGGAPEYFVIDRQGRRQSSLRLPRGTTAGAATTTDALWLFVQSPGTSVAAFVRVPLDTATGRLETRGDTVYTGKATGMSITADGGTLVFDEGTADLTAWKLPLADVVTGKFTDDKLLFRSTNNVVGTLSPDGTMIAIGREVSGGRQYSVMPYDGGAEIQIPGIHVGAVLRDSVTLSIIDVTDSGRTFSVYNYRTRRRSSVLSVPDARLRDESRLGADAWTWIPSGGNVVKVQRDGETQAREIRLPSWYKDIFWISGSPDGRSIAVAGWQAPNEDSLGVAVISVADGRFTQVYTTFGEFAETRWLEDGGLLIEIADTPESFTFYRTRPGGSVERIGSTPRPTSTVSMSADQKRAFVITRDHRRDAWMSKVVR